MTPQPVLSVLEVLVAHFLLVWVGPVERTRPVLPTTVMSAPYSSELKRTLLANGFEVYRTTAGRIVLADRVRDNLIMDSGVAVTADRHLGVRITIRAQASSFPAESQDELWKRARRLGEVAVREGYVEVETSVVPVHDPGDRSRTLDTWYEVAFERAVRDETELVQQLHFALSVEKAV